MRRLIIAAARCRSVWLMLALAACSDHSVEDEIRTSVTVVAHHEGAPVEEAIKRLELRGRAALPTIEAALHTAPVPGRKNLVVALRRIGDEEAIPLLRHFAAHDADQSVRREAAWTLKQWALEHNSRGDKARAAVRALDEEQSSEESG